MATAAEFDVSIVDGIDQESVERDQAEFPTIQWHRGNPTMKKLGGMDYQGGFFISEAAAPVDLEEHGWERTTWTHDDANETDGFYIRDLTFSVIRNRQRWEVYDESSGQRSMFAWSDYDTASAAGRASGRAHWLIVVKGLEEHGPFILTLRGMAGMYFYNRRNSPRSVVGAFDAVVIRAANDAIKKSGRRALMPRRAFWLTVGADRDDKSAPRFTEVGSGNAKSSMVMPVGLGIPEKPAQVTLGEWFVGKELLNRLNTLWDETVEWGAAWDNIEPGAVEGEAKTEEAAEEPEDNDAVVEELGL